MKTIALSILLAGCGGFGVCNDENARIVAYDRQGLPAYSGQALVIRSCISCHAGDRVGAERQGAPAGLDFDLRLASTTTDPNLEAVDRMGRAQIELHGGRGWARVSKGRDPPGEAGRLVLADPSTPVYFTRNLAGQWTQLPEINTAEGRDVFRNWLACGAPLVERTVEPSMALAHPVGFIVPVASPPPP
jgi:hypothetical protein